MTLPADPGTNGGWSGFTETMDDQQSSPVVFYWRPGCGFCMMLQRGLDSHGIGYEARNIWEDTEAAAEVRALADGNETVPTVLVGETAMVNPSIDEVIDALQTSS